MKTLVIITSYKRSKSLHELTNKILNDSDADVVIFDDKSEEKEMISVPKQYASRLNCIINPEHRGKAGFWKTYNDIFAYCKEYVYDYYIIIPDDVEPCPDFVTKAIEAYDKAGCISLSPLVTNRSLLYGVSRFGNKKIVPTEWGFLSHYFDCTGIVKRDFFEALDWKLFPIESSNNPYKSSGVGKQITERMQGKGKPMGHVKRTLLATTDDPSEMNADERKRHPMYADWRDNEPCVDVHMASLWRGGHVVKTVESLMKQHELHTIYLTINSYTQEQQEKVEKQLNALSKKYGKNIVLRKADNEKRSNEKFSQLHKSTAKYIALCDDDIVYPEAYFMRMIQGCQANNAMVSWHGGILKQWPLKRYYPHSSRECLSFRRNQLEDIPCDILGNVFTFFRRDMFTEDEYRWIYDEAGTCSMDDIYLSCLAAKKGIRRIVLNHFDEKANPLCPTHKDVLESDHYVYDQYKDNDSEQVAYINSHLEKSMLVPNQYSKSKEASLIRRFKEQYPACDVWIDNGRLFIRHKSSIKTFKL